MSNFATSIPQRAKFKTENSDETTSLDDSLEKEPLTLAQRLAAKGTSTTTNGMLLLRNTSSISTHRGYGTYALTCSHLSQDFPQALPHYSKPFASRLGCLCLTETRHWNNSSRVILDNHCRDCYLNDGMISDKFRTSLLISTASNLLFNQEYLYKSKWTDILSVQSSDWMHKSNCAIASLKLLRAHSHNVKITRPSLSTCTGRLLGIKNTLTVPLDSRSRHLIRCAVRCVRYAR